VAAAGGDPAEARDRFETASALYERVGHDYWAERTASQAAVLAAV
jgi:hypothetical protein